MSYEEQDYDYCDPYDGDDLEALGQQESWEHSTSEAASMAAEEGDFEDSLGWEDDCYECDGLQEYYETY